jgi:hypothetical protein
MPLSNHVFLLLLCKSDKSEHSDLLGEMLPVSRGLKLFKKPSQ